MCDIPARRIRGTSVNLLGVKISMLSRQLRIRSSASNSSHTFNSLSESKKKGELESKPAVPDIVVSSLLARRCCVAAGVGEPDGGGGELQHKSNAVGRSRARDKPRGLAVGNSAHFLQ